MADSSEITPKMENNSLSDYPEWINAEFFEMVLKERESDKSLKLLHHTLVSATKPGDNFASIALRLKATYTSKGTEKTRSFIVKIEAYKEGFQKDAVSERILFETEIAIYTHILPEMQRLINEIDRKEILAPPLSYASLKPHKIMLIDDISPEFKMSDTPVTFDNAVKVFEKIAKFHALSFYMADNNVSFDQFNEGFISDKIGPMAGAIEMLFNVLAGCVKEWDGPMAAVSQKLVALSPMLYPKLLKLFAPNPRGYNVLNHGDFHIKNILFRETEGKADDVRLIDFQLCTWGSPAIDLNFALYAMVCAEARDQRRQELIRIYHNQFTTILLQLGYLKAIPSLLDLQVELLRNGLIEVFIAGFMMPLVQSDRPNDVEASEMKVDGMLGAYKMGLESPQLKADISKMFPEFLYKGFLD